jgi:ubiquinone/menaquinone biosynthesis C-methylase UbiE
MKATGERRMLAAGGTPEDRVQDLFHLFPYHYVKDLATPSTRVLDVGFGEGYGAEILGDSVAEYVGIDASQEAVRHASARYRLPNVRFQQGDATSMPFPAASFDLVVSFHVLEHVDHPDPYLAELAKVCKVGGHVVIVTPNREFRLRPGERPWNRFHVHEFDTAELQALLARHFEDATVMGVTGTEAMTAVEKNRVLRARRLARLDPFGFRYRLPESLLVHIRRSVALAASRVVQPDLDFSVNDPRCVTTEVAASVHLLALVRRSEGDPVGIHTA